MRAGALLDQLTPDARAAALAALDEISRPLTIREIDHALFDHLSRRERRAVMAGLKGVTIIVIRDKP